MIALTGFLKILMTAVLVTSMAGQALFSQEPFSLSKPNLALSLLGISNTSFVSLDALSPKSLLSQGSNMLSGAIMTAKKEAAAVSQPIETTAIGTLSGQCALVKMSLGMQYEQVKGTKEPDMSEVTLEFRDRIARIIFKLLTAPLDIPKSGHYNPNDTLTIFVHGFTDSPIKEGFTNISQAFATIGNYNVLALDGSSLIKWLYIRSTTYIRFMGEKLGETLASLSKGGLSNDNIHMIGHSLGAHICGFAGKTYYNLTGKRIGRITALDPAGPCFADVEPHLRLHPSDADFVDVIHTDAGVFGLIEPVGHVDFYPGGGSKQPGCLMLGCSHSRAWLYYAESIVNSTAFPAVKCKDWSDFKKGQCEKEIEYMGHRCNSTARGPHFLQTGSEYPYGLGDNGTAFTNDDAFVDKLFAAGQGVAQQLIPNYLSKN